MVLICQNCEQEIKKGKLCDDCFTKQANKFLKERFLKEEFNKWLKEQ